MLSTYLGVNTKENSNLAPIGCSKAANPPQIYLKSASNKENIPPGLARDQLAA